MLAADGKVATDQKHAHSGYKYASADMVYAHIRQGLLEQGLNVYQQEVSSSDLFEGPKDRKGRTTWMVNVYDLAISRTGGGPSRSGTSNGGLFGLR